MKKTKWKTQDGEMTRYDFGPFAAFFDGDGSVEILEGSGNCRALLFWPPAFSLWIGRFHVNWNVFKKLWFQCFIMSKREKGK